MIENDGSIAITSGDVYAPRRHEQNELMQFTWLAMLQFVAEVGNGSGILPFVGECHRTL